jgi:ATP-binding protein involved in chromosome partitioning
MSGFVCPGCHKETQIFVPSSGGVQKMCTAFGVKFLGRIPLDVVLVQAGEQGQPWGSLVEESVGLEMFKDVVAKILE